MTPPPSSLPQKAPLVSLADLKNWNPSKPETYIVKNSFIHCTGSERRDSTASFVMQVQTRRRPNSEPPRARATEEDNDDKKEKKDDDDFDSDDDSLGGDIPFERVKTEPAHYNQGFLNNLMDDDDDVQKCDLSQVMTAGSLPPPPAMMPPAPGAQAVADTGSTPEPATLATSKEPSSPSPSNQDGGSGAPVRRAVGPGTGTPAKVSSPLSHDPMPWGPEVLTVMIRQIPRHYTQLMLLSEVSQRGFQGLFDFLYLPYDFKKGINVGYGFINFIDNVHATAFRDALDGVFLDRHMKQKGKPIRVHPATLQGYEANRQHLAHTKMLQKQDPAFSPLFFRSKDALPSAGDELVDLALHMQTQPPHMHVQPPAPMPAPVSQAQFRNPYTSPSASPYSAPPMLAPQPMQVQAPQRNMPQPTNGRQPQRRNSRNFNRQQMVQPEGIDMMPPHLAYPPAGYPAHPMHHHHPPGAAVPPPMNHLGLMMQSPHAPMAIPQPPSPMSPMTIERDFMPYSMPSTLDMARAPIARYDVQSLPMWPPAELQRDPNSPAGGLSGGLSPWARHPEIINPYASRLP